VGECEAAALRIKTSSKACASCAVTRPTRLTSSAGCVVVQGLDWDIGAIGNAEWAGVRLSDVLKVHLPSAPECQKPVT